MMQFLLPGLAMKAAMSAGFPPFLLGPCLVVCMIYKFRTNISAWVKHAIELSEEFERENNKHCIGHEQ